MQAAQGKGLLLYLLTFKDTLSLTIFRIVQHVGLHQLRLNGIDSGMRCVCLVLFVCLFFQKDFESYGGHRASNKAIDHSLEIEKSKQAV